MPTFMPPSSVGSAPDKRRDDAPTTRHLDLRLLRRLLLVGTLCVVLGAGLCSWLEYREALRQVDGNMAEVMRGVAAPLANSLWRGDVEQTALLLEGLRTAPDIAYSAVLVDGRVLAERGRRRASGALTSTTAIVRRQGGRTLGELTLQVDLAPSRHRALVAALLSLAFNASMVLIIATSAVILVRFMVSRHLADMARHFRDLNMDAPVGPGGSLPALRLRRRPQGDELDSLALAVNRMQEDLAHSYAKALLAEREAKSQARFPEENPNPVLRVSDEDVVTYANKASAGFLEHLRCALGRPIPEPQAEMLRTARQTGQVLTFDIEYDDRAYAFTVRPVPAEGYLNLYGLDVTERKRATDALRRSLAEKDILLKEIHHRVKNNMQLISSLLFLQMERAAPADRETLEEGQKRIQTMAMVHEELYASPDPAFVGLNELIPRLVERALSGANAHAVFDLDEARLPLTRSVPFGLALNELVMNAARHAFGHQRPDGRPGQLSVTLKHDGTGGLLLTVEDDGPGLPPDFDPANADTLGMVLLRSLANQLNAELSAGNAPGGGASFRLALPTRTMTEI